MKIRFMLAATFLSFFAGWNTASAQSLPKGKLTSTQIAAVDSAVAKEMELQKLVGVAIGIIRDREIAYLKGYGLADREKNIRVTAKSVFNWASNCKPVAAVVAMQLVEMGKLDLEKDVRIYVPEFPAKSGVITVRQLLCHQSGIPHYSNGKVIPTKKTYTTGDPFTDCINALDKFNQSPLLFAPGTKTSYSSYAYVLLSAVIQRAGGETFDSQLRKRITTPLHMSSFQFDVKSNGQPNWVVGYTKKRGSAEVVVAPEEANDWKQGAGGYKSNVEDFARWAQGLLMGKLISPKIQQQMWTRQKTKDGKTTNFGLGFVVSEKSNLTISHSGSQRETRTNMVLHPGAMEGVVVLCNCGFANVGALTNAIEAALKGENNARPNSEAKPDNKTKTESKSKPDNKAKVEAKK